MKKTLDDIEVPSRCWYYLLDFNDRDNWKTIMDLYGVEKISLLEAKQFWKLFEVATTREIYNYNNYIFRIKTEKL